MSNLNPSYSERHYQELLKELAAIYPHKEEIDPTPIIEKIKVLETYSLDKNRFFSLFSQEKFFPLYISQNITPSFGYTPEELYKKGLIWVLKRAHWKQLPLVVTVHRWGKKFQKIVDNSLPINNQEAFYCGIKLKDRWGKMRTLFIKQRILTANSTHPILSFLDIEDITAIYKSDYVWGRLIAKDEQQFICRAFFQAGTKNEYADILSARELEILKLATEQKKNTEISELLGISKNTVERHRKNMIARIGVTDMTALIHICKLAQVL